MGMSVTITSSKAFGNRGANCHWMHSLTHPHTQAQTSTNELLCVDHRRGSRAWIYRALRKKKTKWPLNLKMRDVAGLRAGVLELCGLGARGRPTNMIWGKMLRLLCANTPSTPSTSPHPCPPPTKICTPHPS